MLVFFFFFFPIKVCFVSFELASVVTIETVVYY